MPKSRPIVFRTLPQEREVSSKGMDYAITGGILDVSIISFHTIESAKSADVVGSNCIELILYSPIPNQIKLIAIKASFAVCVSTSKLENARSMPNIFVMGVEMAELKVLIEKIFREDPDMYIIKAFMATCDPGFVAMDMAFCFRLAKIAAVF